MDDRHEDKYLGKILFKHYKLKKKIGEGSFGKIYIAINIDTREEYAVKLVSIALFYKHKKIINNKNNNIKFVILLFYINNKI
jgi:serine/threonine protein kinase